MTAEYSHGTPVAADFDGAVLTFRLFGDHDRLDGVVLLLDASGHLHTLDGTKAVITVVTGAPGPRTVPAASGAGRRSRRPALPEPVRTHRPAQLRRHPPWIVPWWQRP